MNKKILNEIENIKYLLNYNRTKTLKEQSETPVPTPTPAAQAPVPTPTPAASSITPGEASSITPGEASSITPEASSITSGEASSITPDGRSSFSRIELGPGNDPYQYKFEDDGKTQKYYYAKKGQNDWKQSTNPKSVEAIKKNVFKIR